MNSVFALRVDPVNNSCRVKALFAVVHLPGGHLWPVLNVCSSGLSDYPRCSVSREGVINTTMRLTPP
jgi:hypothetical protein